MIVHVYCGNYVGPPHWHGLEVFEPDECNWEGNIEVHPDEISFAGFTCGGCGARNAIRDHEVTDVGPLVAEPHNQADETPPGGRSSRGGMPRSRPGANS